MSVTLVAGCIFLRSGGEISGLPAPRLKAQSAVAPAAATSPAMLPGSKSATLSLDVAPPAQQSQAMLPGSKNFVISSTSLLDQVSNPGPPTQSAQPSRALLPGSKTGVVILDPPAKPVPQTQSSNSKP